MTDLPPEVFNVHVVPRESFPEFDGAKAVLYESPDGRVVSAMDASSARVTGAANLGRSAAVIIAAPTPATTRHASATRSLRRKRGVGQKKPNSG